MIRKNEGNQSDLPLTISAQHGLVDQRDYFNNQVASRDMSGYYLLENGEFAYNKSTSGDSPWGAIKRLTKYEKGCLSTLYICFGLDLGDPDFLVTYYETNRWHGAVQMIAAEGARNHGLLNIAPDDFFETVLTLPCSTEEQKQIGCFFTQLNSLITLHQRKCQYRGLYGYLSWEQRKLGELCELNPTAVLPGSFEYVDLESVVGTDMISHRREEKLTAPSRAQRLASFGDIFYQTVRPYQKNNYFYELPDKDYVFSTGYAQLRPLCDGRFLFSSLQRDQFVSCVLEHCTGTSYPAINSNDLAALSLAVPIDAKEQRLVGLILKPIDSLITLHQ